MATSIRDWVVLIDPMSTPSETFTEVLLSSPEGELPALVGSTLFSPQSSPSTSIQDTEETGELERAITVETPNDTASESPLPSSPQSYTSMVHSSSSGRCSLDLAADLAGVLGTPSSTAILSPSSSAGSETVSLHPTEPADMDAISILNLNSPAEADIPSSAVSSPATETPLSHPLRCTKATPDLRITIPPSHSRKVEFLGLINLKASTRSSICGPVHGSGDLGEYYLRHLSPAHHQYGAPTPTFTAAPESAVVEVELPIFPFPSGTSVCRERGCPIREWHEQGPYLHKGKLRTRKATVFGASNPPDEIWEAWGRLVTGRSEDVMADRRMVDAFVEYHFGFTDAEGARSASEKLEQRERESPAGFAQLVRGVAGWFNKKK